MSSTSDRARSAAGAGAGWLSGLWKRDPLWGSLMIFGGLMGLLYILGPTGQAGLLKTVHNVGRDPVATMQAWGAGAALSLGALAGIAHFFPPTHDLGDRMIRGLVKGLIVLFVGVPLLGWGTQHVGNLGQLLAGFGIGR